MRPGQAKGPSVGSSGSGGGGGGAVNSVDALFPIVSSGGTDPVVTFAGITTPGLAGQSIRMNVGGTGFEYYTPVVGDLTAVTGTSPIAVTSGTGPIPNVSLAGLTSLGSSGDFVGSTGSSWYYVGSTGSGMVVLNDAPNLTGDVIIQGALLVDAALVAISGGGTPLLGLFGADAVPQPTYTGTSVPNPVLDTETFISRIQELVSGLLALGAFRSV